jgi:hypothetical protein
MTFAKGASLADPSGHFNSNLEGNTRARSISTRATSLDEEALKSLIRAALAMSSAHKRELPPHQSCPSGKCVKLDSPMPAGAWDRMALARV